MRVRHKVPAIFSLSMVDMLCCALGCVILVWLLNAKQAEDDAAASRDEISALTRQAEEDRAEGRRLLSAAMEEYDKATARVRALTGERDKAMADISDLKKRLSGTQDSLAVARQDLAGTRKELGDERAKSKALAGRVTSLDEGVRSERMRLDEEKKKSAGLARQVSDRDDALKSTRTDLAKREASLKTTQAELVNAKEKAEAALAARDKELKARDKELAAAWEKLEAMSKVVSERQAALAAADLKLAKSEKQRQILTTAVETRFAGIELTGERVVFLVDMSGSMEMIDEATNSPSKWVEVRETVARVMRSLPKLEKYQVIAFGPKYDYPLGGAGKWLDMDPKSSPDAVLKALAAIKPRGGTNMYVALEEAFRFRAQGLDTIYLLSDGLPNNGEGLTPTQAATLPAIEKGVILGKHVRTTLKFTWNRPIADKRVKIHTVGFFYESPDLGSFLWALSRENDGSFVGMSRP